MSEPFQGPYGQPAGNDPQRAMGLQPPAPGDMPYQEHGGASYRDPDAPSSVQGGAPYQMQGGAPYQMQGGAPYQMQGGAPYQAGMQQPVQGYEPHHMPGGTPMGNLRARVEMNERPAFSIGGGIALLALLALFAVSFFLWASARSSVGASSGGAIQMLLAVLCFIVFVLGLSSLTIVQPGETKVLQFFGKYIGTIRKTGLLFTIPLTSKRKVSVKVNNFETHELKVNDSDGNPVNIAAIIVWQVTDTARTVFAVENYGLFVAVQAEAALRHIASSHPYDNASPGEPTLRGSTELVADELAQEVAARVAIAGIEVVEARISSLAYAPEIAQAMLQRQQAAAVIAAREKIVEGAVGMVENALHMLQRDDIVSLDDDSKAALVSNLLVVLCSDSRATPMVNAGA